MRMRALFLAVFLAATQPVTADAVGAQRSFQVDDLFNREALGEVAPGPDGQTIAAVVQRAADAGGRAQGHGYAQTETAADARSDIWLISTEGATRNLTQGIKDGRGHWSPRWSPNGTQLAFLSVSSSGDVHLSVWNTRTKRVTVVTKDRNVYSLAHGGFGSESEPIQGVDGQGGPFAWLDEGSIVLLLLPSGSPNPNTAGKVLRGPMTANSAWDRIQSRSADSASVLETSPSASLNPLAPATLAIIDVVDGTMRAIGDVPYQSGSNFNAYPTISVSPNRKFAAILADDGVGHQSSERPLELFNLKVGMVGLDGSGGIRWLDRNRYPLHVRPLPLQPWSPDGTKLIFASRDGDLFQMSMHSGDVQKMDLSGRKVPAAYLQNTWAADGRPLVLARTGESSETRWMIWQQSDRFIPLGEEGAKLPESLYRSQTPGAYVGIRDGDLWRVDTVTGAMANLTEKLDKEIVSIVTSPKNLLTEVGGKWIAVKWSGSRNQAGYALVPLVSGQPIRELALPHPNAELILWQPEQRLLLFKANTSGGTVLWRGEADSKRYTVLLTLNRWLEDVADVQRQIISYRHVDGSAQKALVLLPPGYDARRHSPLPLVAWVYAGNVVHDEQFDRDRLHEKNDPSMLNLLPLMSHGYAVIIPSMPLSMDPKKVDPYLDLPKGVMPAIDQAIDLGIADPNRLAIMGISYGGYSVFSLVTYTSRFKAAIAINGLSNLVSNYGVFESVTDRFGDRPHTFLWQESLSEGGQMRTGVAPWLDYWRYIRNSPISYVHRVQTPLMIIAGDQDPIVSMTQSEEFFTALHRQGKEAKFIRYWGEGHSIEAPANIRHMWREIIDWFDTHLPPVTQAEASSTNRH